MFRTQYAKPIPISTMMIGFQCKGITIRKNEERRREDSLKLFHEIASSLVFQFLRKSCPFGGRGDGARRRVLVLFLLLPSSI